MPRTKQTKPRHIVENNKASGEPSSPQSLQSASPTENDALEEACEYSTSVNYNENSMRRNSEDECGGIDRTSTTTINSGEEMTNRAIDAGKSPDNETFSGERNCDVDVSGDRAAETSPSSLDAWEEKDDVISPVNRNFSSARRAWEESPNPDSSLGNERNSASGEKASHPFLQGGGNMPPSEEAYDRLDHFRDYLNQSNTGGASAQNGVNTQNNTFDNPFKLFGEQLHQDPLQYHVASAAASQYWHAMKTILENGGKAENGVDFWKAWAEATRSQAQQVIDSSESSNIFNRYKSQLTERWNSIMMQQFSNSDPFGQFSQNAAANKPSLTQTDRHLLSYYQKAADADDKGTVPGMITPPLSAHTQSSKSSETTSLDNAGSSFEGATIHEIDVLKQSPGNNDTNEKEHSPLPNQVAPNADNSSSLRGAPSPISIPAFNHSQTFQHTSPLSAPAYGHERFGHLAFNPFTSYRPWSATSWLGYQSPKLASAFYYPQHSSSENIPFGYGHLNQDRSKSRSKYSGGITNSLPNDKITPPEVVSETNNDLPTYSFSQSKRLSPNNHLTNSKPSDSTALVKTGYHHSQFLEEIRRHYGVPQPPFASPWLGAGLPLKPVTSPKFPAVQSPLPSNSSSTKPQMFFPSRVPGISSSGYQLGNSVSPNGTAAFSPNLPYKPDPAAPLSPSVGKINSPRRSRTRGPPIDSVHAAIVREAKEQFKGLDPENMYIQCPICQKRIKRLYHFQRHMRIHTGEKSHQCPCCQYKSVRKDNLKSHMKTHEKQTLESSRKSGKSYQNNRSSDIASSKVQNRSPIQAADNLAQDKPSRVQATSEAPGAAKTNAGDVTGRTSSQLPWKGMSGYKHGYSSSFPNSYSMPYFTDSYRHASTNMGLPENKHAIVNKNNHKMLELSSALSKPLNSSTTRQEEAVEKKENGGRSADLREKLRELAAPKPHSTPQRADKSLDVGDKFNESMKRSHGGYQLNSIHLPSYGEERSSKRQKLIHELESQRDESSYHNNDSELNLNNNNDTSRMAGGVQNQSFFPYFANVSPNAELTKTSKSWLPLHSGVINRTVNDQQNKHFETAREQENRFGSVASATLAGLAAAAAAAANRGCQHQDVNPETSTADAAGQKSPEEQADTKQGGNTSAFPSIQKVTMNAKVEVSSSRSNNSALRHNGLYDDVKPGRGAGPNAQGSSLALPVKKDPGQFGEEVKEAQKNETRSETNISNNGRAKVRSPVFAKDNERRSEDLTPASKGLVCRLCAFSSSSNTELQSHMSATHKQDGFYKCDECNYLGKNLSKLVEHIRIHTGERPFKCDQCNYAAKRKDNLAQHKAVRHDKRKTKTNNLYAVLDQINRDSVSAAPAAFAAGVVPHSGDSKSPSRNSDRFPVFQDVRFPPKLDTAPDYGRDYEKDKSPSSTAPPTPPFHAFPAMHALPPSVFQYPFYPPPPMMHPSDLRPGMAGNPSKNSPGTYSVKVRAALITP